jgi:hypothetical protein
LFWPRRYAGLRVRGLRSTGRGCDTVYSRRHPVVPVGCFEGAARFLPRVFPGEAAKYGPRSEANSQESVPMVLVGILMPDSLLCIGCRQPREAHPYPWKNPAPGKTHCIEFKSMDLPAGKTCDDCFHFRRCSALFGPIAGNTHCDWFPIRFAHVERTPLAKGENSGEGS